MGSVMKHLHHIPPEFYTFLTSLINCDGVKDEFSKLAYTPRTLWGKRRMNLVLTNLGMDFNKYIWYKYTFSNPQALQMGLSCLKDTVNCCLVFLLCEMCSENDTRIYLTVFFPLPFCKRLVPLRSGDDYVRNKQFGIRM